MPRESYHTPTGNPFQFGRLPLHSLDFEFHYTGDSPTESRSLRNWLLVRILLADAAFCTIFVLLRPAMPGNTLLLTVHGVAFLLLWTIETIWFRQYRPLFRLLRIVLAYALCRALSLPEPATTFLFIAALLGTYIHAFGAHWIQRCTESPLPRERARKLREHWKGNLLIVSLVPLAAAIAAIHFDSAGLFPALLASYVAFQLIRCRDLKRLRRAGRLAITSWCAYNVANLWAPGISRSPAGTARMRQLRLSGDSFFFGWLCLLITFGAPAAPLPPFPFLLFPGLAFLLLPPLLLAPLLTEGLRCRQSTRTGNHWESLVNELRTSFNPIARDSYFIGHVASDGSPLLVGRDVFNEPSHFLGSTGAGKTSKGLAPWIEQTIGFGDSTLIVIDLKADTLETLATMISAEEKLRRTTGRHLPLKLFSSQNDLPTHGFNPLGFGYWNQFSLYQRTDILCGALGLIYGSDYGEGYYSSANAETCYETLRCFPQVRTFRELAERCRHVLTNAGKFELLPNTARNADHFYSQLKRLADFEQLQTRDDGRFPKEAVENGIDLTDLFRRPQMVYLHLSTSLGAGSAPAIARLFTYLLLTAATRTERQCKVYLVIDEFQRMVADNLEYVLQLARSMGVGVVLANQSMADLRSRRTDMISIIEANCRFRQWFDVPSDEDRKRLMAVVGETVETLTTNAVSSNSNGMSYMRAEAQTIQPRININEILTFGDDPNLSLVRLARGSGYAQYGGFPVIVRSGFHIDQEEYERRKSISWPELAPGMFVPRDLDSSMSPPSPPPGPKIIREVDGREVSEQGPANPNVSDLFDGLSQPESKKPRRRRRKPE
jgi:hypothetical protein